MEQEKLIEQWYNGIRIFHIAHHLAASHYSRMHLMLGIPVVILTTVVGATVFSTLEVGTHIIIKVIIGIFSVAAAIISALQTFLKYSELAEKHKNAAAKYGALRRELDEIKLTINNISDFKEVSKDFRSRWDCVVSETPTIPQNIHDKAAKNFPSKYLDKSE